MCLSYKKPLRHYKHWDPTSITVLSEHIIIGQNNMGTRENNNKDLKLKKKHQNKNHGTEAGPFWKACVGI